MKEPSIVSIVREVKRYVPEYEGYSTSRACCSSEVELRDAWSRCITRVLRRVETVKIHFSNEGKLLYFDDLTKLNRLLEQGLGRIRQQESNRNNRLIVDVDARCQLALGEVDRELLVLLDELEGVLHGLAASKTPVEDFDTAEQKLDEFLERYDRRCDLLREQPVVSESG